VRKAEKEINMKKLLKKVENEIKKFLFLCEKIKDFVTI